MKFTRRAILWSCGITILLVFVILLAIRYTNTSLSNSEKVILGFDEKSKRFQFFERKTYSLAGEDGPYIIGNDIYQVTSESEMIHRQLRINGTLTVKVYNQDKDSFKLVLQDSLCNDTDIYNLPDKLIAISDIEGNFNGFSSFLINNKIMDTDYNWTWGNGHLILNGDFVDRGENVTQVLWLIYKLDKEARNQGGKVHYILGNHEIMNFQGNSSYNNDKYRKIAQVIGKTKDLKTAVQFMYSESTELGKWLRSKNAIEKIGNYIFVHAGIHPDILQYNISIPQINEIVRNNWDKDVYHEKEDNKIENLLCGKKGIYWYRGLATNYKYYEKISEDELNEILNHYHASKIVFGHSLVEDITKDFNGKVINIDVKHGQEKNSGKTKGLLIENGMEYEIDDNGIKTAI